MPDAGEIVEMDTRRMFVGMEVKKGCGELGACKVWL